MFVIAFVLLGVEFLRYAARKEMTWSLIGDSLTNYVTLMFYLLLTAALIAAVYINVYYVVAEFGLFEFETNWLAMLACLVLADFAYYWEHRFTHRVNLAWATHTVHHSSPNFNFSVAYRFGPMDAVWPIPFHIPILLLGFDPLLVLFAEVIVQEYQTFIHTEAVKKLPRPIEALFNTPSHHRVHHGSNPQYLDKNYGGILIIWDRLFGTFEEEQQQVTYGLVEPINSVNPVVVWLHGVYRLIQKARSAKGPGGKMQAIFAPPEWDVRRQGS